MRNMNRVVLHSSLRDSRARGMWCRGRDFVGSDSTSRTPSTPCHSGLEAYEQRPVRPYFKEGALCTPKPEVSHLSRGEKPARQPQPTPSRSRHLLFHVHSRPATCTNPAPKTGIYIPPAHCSFPQRTPPKRAKSHQQPPIPPRPTNADPEEEESVRDKPEKAKQVDLAGSSHPSQVVVSCKTTWKENKRHGGCGVHSSSSAPGPCPRAAAARLVGTQSSKP